MRKCAFWALGEHFRTAFNCTEACPRGIEVTKAISDVEPALNTGEF